MATLSTRTYRLVVAPADVISANAHTTVNANGDTVVTEPANTSANEQQTGRNLSALDMTFKVKRTLKHKPNVATVRVFGMSPKTRLYFSTPKSLSLSLEAGYDGDNELLFLGQIRNSHSQQEGAENVTTFETGDSEKVMAAAGIQATWGAAGISIATALRTLQSTIPQVMSGSQVSNWNKQNAFLATLGETVLHPVGGAIDLRTNRYIDNICRSAGLEWSIQNGQIYVLPKGGTEASREIVLSEDSGLIGSPSVDNAGFLRVKSLILKGLHPGALVRVKAQNVSGDYRIDSAEWIGGTQAGHREWYCEMLCTDPKNAAGGKTGF